MLELGQQLAETSEQREELKNQVKANETLIAELEQSVEAYSSKQNPGLVCVFIWLHFVLIARRGRFST
jgi:hypothetical protein